MTGNSVQARDFSVCGVNLLDREKIKPQTHCLTGLLENCFLKDILSILGVLYSDIFLNIKLHCSIKKDSAKEVHFHATLNLS